jgi:flagellin-like hook-associated protein FlgL
MRFLYGHVDSDQSEFPLTRKSFRANSDFQSGVIQRLTSGYRISRAGDDPAGLAIANRFRTDSGELSQGIRNLNDGLSRYKSSTVASITYPRFWTG